MERRRRGRVRSTSCGRTRRPTSIVWSVDLNGNYLTQTAPLSGTSYALQALETSFSHDLNGDGTTGVKTGATIEAVGGHKLVQQADAYTIMPTAASTGVC